MQLQTQLLLHLSAWMLLMLGFKHAFDPRYPHKEARWPRALLGQAS